MIFSKVPRSDEEVLEQLKRDVSDQTGVALCSVYQIERDQGMGVLDAYRATLNFWIDAGKRVRA